MSENSTNTVVRIAGIDIPIHLAWNKIEVLNTGADLLDMLNEKYPHLATEFTHGITSIVRERISETLGDIKPPPKKEVHLIEFLLEKLAAGIDPLDIIDMAQQEKNVEMTLEDLVYLVGEDAYMDAMKKQAIEFHMNKILPEQIADLWNQADMPAPGKQHWVRKDVERLLGIDESSGWD